MKKEEKDSGKNSGQRNLGRTATISWDMLGWFVFALIVFVIVLAIMMQMKGGSFTLVDDIFGVFG